ncbi:hypothetical protein Pla144_15600 [Bythopirellula polymerisocia]|uniref:Uncharacterized protein n=1 Tax=Bythopirellula polymerisocia TaxID=2528003 RepID=A0A5C6CTK7_9BACT|nr:hypothetical protein Pla144_15600 [Bythopirellula polymerisocia]
MLSDDSPVFLEFLGEQANLGAKNGLLLVSVSRLS